MIQLNPWDLIIFHGYGENGKEYNRVSFTQEVMWSNSFVETLKEAGVKVVEVKQAATKKRKEAD